MKRGWTVWALLVPRSRGPPPHRGYVIYDTTTIAGRIRIAPWASFNSRTPRPVNTESRSIAPLRSRHLDKWQDYLWQQRLEYPSRSPCCRIRGLLEGLYNRSPCFVGLASVRDRRSQRTASLPTSEAVALCRYCWTRCWINGSRPCESHGTCDRYGMTGKSRSDGKDHEPEQVV